MKRKLKVEYTGERNEDLDRHIKDFLEAMRFEGQDYHRKLGQAEMTIFTTVFKGRDEEMWR